MKSVILRMTLALVLSLSVYQTGLCSETANQQKVIIFPPVLNGPADLDYLRQGLVDMLTTRLTDPGKVVAVAAKSVDMPSGPVTRSTAAASARNAGARYAVFGSLTLLGNHISTDLRMIDVESEAVTVAFSRSGDDPSSLIEHADMFAAQANQKAFKRSPKKEIVAQPQAGTAKVPPAPKDQIYQHPEKLLQQPIAVGDDAADGSLVTLGSANAVRGPRINNQVQSLAIGDVDGDGLPEVAITGISKLWIYKYTNGRFAKMAEFKGSGNYVGVDVSDVNEDGKAEIFVTNFDNINGRVSSFVMEYDGRRFKRTHELLDFYFRAINVPMRGRVLFGQRQALEKLFQPGIYEIIYENGKYRRGNKLKVPRGQNIFGMGLGKLSESPDAMVFAYGSSLQLRIMDPNGREEWVSSGEYGSSAAMVQTKSIDDLSGSDYHHLKGRIEILDIDGDSVDEAVVLNNEDVTGSFAKRTRIFKHGRIEVLKSDQLGLIARLRTRFLPKYISDFAIGDMDGDGQPEILTAVVQQSENITSSGRSNIFMFNLGGMLAAEGEGKE